MKKTTIAAMVAAAMLICACQKEHSVNPKKINGNTLADGGGDTSTVGGSGEQGGPKLPPH